MNNAPLANPSYSFNVNTQGTDHHFNYKGAKLGIRTALPLLWPAFPLAIWFGAESISAPFSLSGFLTYFFFYLALIVTGLMLLLNFFRRGGSFIVGKEGITVDGRTYAYSNIHSMYVKSPKGSRGMVIVSHSGGGYGVQGAMHGIGNGINQVGAEVGEALKESIRNKSYKVCIQFGEKEIAIAKKLTSLTAKVILEKIDELI